MRATLVTALSSCVGDPKKRRARRFLQGLSADELQYIAEFLGCCILEPGSRCACTRGQLAQRITQFERCRRGARGDSADGLQDVDHKMILLLEYLCRCGPPQFTLAASAGQTQG